MANHLDLEEQEQLDQLKHFWNIWGTLITAILIVVFGSVAAWNGYRFWQNREALQASALLDVVESAVQTRDEARLEQAFMDIRNKYANTIQAGQAGLMVAKLEVEKNNLDAAKNALKWVAESASDEGYKALAQLRLASILMDEKSYDAAFQSLSGKFPAKFNSIVFDRKGDILVLQDKKQEAIAEYSRSYVNLSDTAEYRRLLEFKLSALGVKPEIMASLEKAEAVK